jgi:hypothetical protein
MPYHEKDVYDNLEFKSWVSEREKTLLRFNSQMNIIERRKDVEL